LIDKETTHLIPLTQDGHISRDPGNDAKAYNKC